MLRRVLAQLALYAEAAKDEDLMKEEPECGALQHVGMGKGV